MDEEALSPSEDLIRRAREELAEADVEPILETEPPNGDVADGTEGAPEVMDPPPPIAETPRLGPPGEGPIIQGSGPAQPTAPPGPEAPAEPGRGLTFAIGAAALGALAWALLLAYADLQSWLLGIGIGWLIGTATIYGAGRLTSGLRVTVALLAMGSVVLGEVLGLALLWNKEFGVFDFPLAFDVYFGNLDELGGGLLFALGGGALGAWTAVTTDKSRK